MHKTRKHCSMCGNDTFNGKLLLTLNVKFKDTGKLEISNANIYEFDKGSSYCTCDRCGTSYTYREFECLEAG